MDFASNQKTQINAMLKEIGISSVDDLYDAVPTNLMLPAPTEDDGLSEYEGLKLMQSLAKENTFQNFDNYLGAGAYEHHQPAIVDAICSRAEFLTAYTPYQPEASQGMLQAIYEYQKAVCALTGMGVSNASLYDGASACAEALLMALRINKNRNEILISSTLNPKYRAVVDQYMSSHSVIVKTLPHNLDWKIDKDALLSQISENTAALLIQSPNYLGLMENIAELNTILKESGVLLVLCANPLSYGIYASAGELNVDIAIGDCQPFGLPLEFGGPYVGYLSCKKEFIRQMPGRFVGETLDMNGKKGYVLTLQAREQHIRREKATSNICTNQALAALASLIAIMWYGKVGVNELAQTNYARCAYLKESLKNVSGVSLLKGNEHFNEFPVNFGVPFKKVQHHFRSNHIEPGVYLGEDYPKMKDYFLVAVTETKSKQQLDHYVQVASTLAKS